MLRGPRLLAALLLVPACAEDSSFVLRWRVGRTADDADKTPLLSVRQCSDLGLSRVRVTTLRDDDNSEVDVREFSCFPDEFTDPDGAAPGPELAPGTYRVNVVGLTRRGQTRPDPADPTNDDKTLARDVARVVVEEKGAGTLVDSFRLFGVDECHDGIDNDLDGAVDQSDVPCRRGLLSESLDATGAQFTFRSTLLPSPGDPPGQGNPRATCDGLGIASFRVTLDDDPARTREVPCSEFVQPFSTDLPPGLHTWAVEAVDAAGDPLTTPLTGEPFEIFDRQYRLVEIDVAFTLATFLAEPAFSDPQTFTIEFESALTPELPRYCSEDDSATTITTVEITFYADTATDAMVPLGDAVKLVKPDLAFPLVLDCQNILKPFQTNELPWSASGNIDYYMKVEAWADDPAVVCFSNADSLTRLAPGEDVFLTIPRVEDACPP